MIESIPILLSIEEELRTRQRERDKELYDQQEEERKDWEVTVSRGRNNFWQFCKLKSPGYFTESKPHLKKFCDILQALYEKRIIKFSDEEQWQIVATTEGLQNFIVCKKIMINLPPRHGKTRTLTNFTQWILGKNNEERIIECSYNDNLAGEFAKFTRDGIQEERVNDAYFVFSDFFPETKIKKGSSSYYNWALEGQHFNYLGAGLGGGITGKGGSVLMIDDAIKSEEEAFNENRLQTIWNWYTGTFLSRGDAEGGEPIEVIVMTRWANGDLCGRILEDSIEAKDWFIFKLAAYNEQKDEMLCEEVLSKKRYLELRRKMIPEVFLANYHQETIDQKGRLYSSFKTYTDLPRDPVTRELLFEVVKNYTDTADEGSDWLCSICYGVYKSQAYVLDVYYTKEPMEVTEPKTADMLIKNKVNLAKIESNNGGRGFARNVQREVKERYQKSVDEAAKLSGQSYHEKIEEANNIRKIIVRWFHQSRNKRGRIMSQSANVQQDIYLPINWKDRWPEYHKAMNTYLREGKNAHDDGPDCTTGVAENMAGGIEILK